MSNEPRIEQLFNDLKAAGYHPFPAPCGVMMDEQNMALQHMYPLPDLRWISLPGPCEDPMPRLSASAPRYSSRTLRCCAMPVLSSSTRIPAGTR